RRSAGSISGRAARVAGRRHNRLLQLTALRLEEFYGVTRRIVHDDLATAVALDDLAAERTAPAAQILDRGVEVIDRELEAAPPARCGHGTVRHRLASPACARGVEEQAQR